MEAVWRADGGRTAVYSPAFNSPNGQAPDLVRHKPVAFLHPCRNIRRKLRVLTQVMRKDQGIEIGNAHPIRHQKDLLEGRITDGQTSDRASSPIDHDVAAQALPAVAPSMLTIFLTGVVDAQRNVKAAVGVEQADAVEPLRHLSFPSRRDPSTARRMCRRARCQG